MTTQTAEFDLVPFARENRFDLEVLGLTFLRLLAADFYILSPDPSPTLAAMMALDSEERLAPNKGLIRLLQELKSAGIPPMDDGFKGSILRL